MRMEKYLQDSAATEALGRSLGRHARSGDVFCLSGDLGAGKTLLSRGVASALGVAANDVSSPTFALLNIYQGGEMEVRHFDLYRLRGEEELDDIGFDEYAGGAGVTLIEWAELFRERMPLERLDITLLREGAGRKAVCEARGGRYRQLLEEVARDAGLGD